MREKTIHSWFISLIVYLSSSFVSYNYLAFSLLHLHRISKHLWSLFKKNIFIIPWIVRYFLSLLSLSYSISFYLSHEKKPSISGSTAHECFVAIEKNYINLLFGCGSALMCHRSITHTNTILPKANSFSLFPYFCTAARLIHLQKMHFWYWNLKW